MRRHFVIKCLYIFIKSVLSRWIGVRRKGFVIVYNACIITLMFFRIPKQARAYNSLFKEGS